MIFHFKAHPDVVLTDDHKAYIERKFGEKVSKFMQHHGEAQGEDTVDIRVSFDRTSHLSGNTIEGHATIFCAHHGKFHAEAAGPGVEACADALLEKLRTQMKKFKETH